MRKPVKPSRRNVLTFLGSATAGSLLPRTLSAQIAQTLEAFDDIPFSVADTPWVTLLGNHRVHLWVENPAEAVHVHIPWRRVDQNPELKALQLFDPQGSEVLNFITGHIGAESGDVVFEAKHSGIYRLYYLPQAEVKGNRSALGPKGRYRSPQQTADAAWAHRFTSSRSTQSSASWRRLPQARVIEFQARTALDSFYPMEVAATVSEVQRLCATHPTPILLFPEDRDHPIQMKDVLPRRWIQSGPQHTFSATVLLGEFYVFQIGVYANAQLAKADTTVSIQFDDLGGADGMQIPAAAFTCLNLSGVDAHGVSFNKDVNVKPGGISALWCGIQVPLDGKPGKYTGTLHVVPKGATGVPVRFNMEVQRDFIRDGGVDEPWRRSRIKWLNSTIGSDDTLTAPYTALQHHDRTVSCLGREIEFAESGFPTSVRANGREILAAPIELKVFNNSQAVPWTSTSRIESSQSARVVMVSESHGDDYDLKVRSTVEFDGGIGFEVKLVSRRTRPVSDIALEIPYAKDAAPYVVGMGLRGGKRPQNWQWKWSDQPASWKEQGSNLEFFSWIGGVDAGLYCRLKSPLDDWKNGSSGGVSITETGNRVLFRVSTGSRTVRAGDEMNFSFRLLPTPVKPLDLDHWKYRYVQAYQPPESLQALGASVINLHQGTLPNLYINYPFLNLDILGPYVSTAHALGMKVKLYYTMRELTTRLPELWTFRSLGDEIYRVGGTQGQGNPQLDFWLQEHLREDYSPGWIQRLPTGDADTSLRVYSDSRLANFYLEGLKWLLDNAQIDGLYLDEIGYPRATMQRVRRVLQRRPGAMIDMHGNNVWWSCNCPIGYYMEHLPYIDRLWLGEGFNPDFPPDYWLVEMSGIPFGLSSDMLNRPNPWRGMLFGMTDRALWSHAPSPTPIWKLWNRFGIENTTMVGWWDDNVPVTTGRDDVLATVYSKDNKALIAIASWAKQTTSIQLQIDWNKLGLDPKLVKITAPALENFQDANSFSPTQSISVPPGKGYLLILE